MSAKAQVDSVVAGASHEQAEPPTIGQDRDMTDLALNPDDFIHGDEDAAGPIIQVVVSLTYPGMNQLVYDEALVERGRSNTSS